MYSIISTVHIVLFVLVFILGINVIVRALRGRTSYLPNLIVKQDYSL
jgi:hypothetical protein